MGADAVGKYRASVRSVFKWGVDSGLLDHAPRYGAQFKKPAKAVLRRHRASKGQRMFEAADLKSIIDGAAVPLKAMILLGANCGFGNSDIATLPLAAVDLKRGWVNYARPKTGVDRRCPLWQETIDALQAALDARPAPKADEADGLFFVTRCGAPWGSVRLDKKEDGRTVCNTDDPIAKEFRKLIIKLKLHRPGLGFYGLRHGFETIAGGSRDQVATDSLMGHSRSDMASVYRERIDDERLVDVANHVHDWLFPADETGPTDGPDTNDDEQADEEPIVEEAEIENGASDRPRLRLVMAG